MKTSKDLFFKIYLSVIMAILVLNSLFPIVWLVDFSLAKSGDFFSSNILLIPNPPMWQNYVDAFINAHIPLLFINSALVCLISVFITLVVSISMGYAFTRMEWKLNRPLFSIVLIAMIVPIYSTLLPNFLVFKDVGILDSYLALILPYIAFQIPVSMFIITGFLKSIPRALEEAAVIDGLNLPGLIYRIVVPVSKPAIATVAVLAFLSNWNEFIMAVTYISKDVLRTLPFAVVYFMGQYSSNYGAQFAVLAIILLPSILIYLIFSEQITKGITTGAVKG